MGLWGERPSSDPSFASMCSFLSELWFPRLDLHHSAEALTAMVDVKGLAKEAWFPPTPSSGLLPSML